jgi:hypothetical protein
MQHDPVRPNPAVVGRLLAAGADPTLTSFAGESPLDVVEDMLADAPVRSGHAVSVLYSELRAMLVEAEYGTDYGSDFSHWTV